MHLFAISHKNGYVRTTSASDSLSSLHRVSEVIGKDKLGFHWSSLGANSAQLAADVAIFLDGM